MEQDKVKKLAKLARIDISDTEAEDLSKDLGSILGYIGEISNAKSDSNKVLKPALKNVLREDNNPHDSGIYTEKILDEAPYREGQYLKVKKIL